MTKPGFRLSKLAVVGAGYANAEMEFSPGLNVIAGASNTGKTYVFRAIDFMLGSSSVPEQIPESRGYTHGQLELQTYGGKTYTLSRALAGGEARLFEVPLADVRGDTPSRTLGARAGKGSNDTIPAFLLGITGLLGREVRRNELGEKSALSFRDVSWLTQIDEERIITKESPFLSGQYVEATKEKAVFGLFLTGTDDAAIIPQEKSKDRKARLQAELGLLKDIITQREQALVKAGVQVEHLDQQRSRLEQSIQRASSVVATQQSKIDELAERRDTAWKQVQENERQKVFLGEQLKRLRLLRAHYDSDSARLESAYEAGAAFEQLPTGECPVCGHKPDGRAVVDSRLSEFRASCQAELKKIKALCKDLDSSMEIMRADHARLQAEIARLEVALEKANQDIEEALQPKLEAADSKLSDLLAVQTRLIEASSVNAEIQELRGRYTAIEQALEVKVKPQKLAAKVETRTAAKFCDFVAATLKAWKYPQLGTVSFDPVRFDIVIGEQNRGSMGKGYRALTHAAMAISLMRYCRSENLPHPGFVVVDTPLNPFRGPDEPASERVNQEVQNAFYSDLSKDSSGDQVIVLENTEPPVHLRSAMNYVHLSGTMNQGRYGFFPLPTQKP